MNPHDILDVADALATGATEAEWRSAASRAYYAAFHVARLLMRHCGFGVPHGDQAHGYLWLRLANCGHVDVQLAGDRLNELRRARNWADYDLDVFFDHTVALRRVQVATDVIQLLESVPTVPTVQTAITDAMRVYERDVLHDVTWHP